MCCFCSVVPSFCAAFLSHAGVACCLSIFTSASCLSALQASLVVLPVPTHLWLVTHRSLCALMISLLFTCCIWLVCSGKSTHFSLVLGVVNRWCLPLKVGNSSVNFELSNSIIAVSHFRAQIILRIFYVCGRINKSHGSWAHLTQQHMKRPTRELVSKIESFL